MTDPFHDSESLHRAMNAIHGWNDVRGTDYEGEKEVIAELNDAVSCLSVAELEEFLYRLRLMETTPPPLGFGNIS